MLPTLRNLLTSHHAKGEFFMATKKSSKKKSSSKGTSKKKSSGRRYSHKAGKEVETEMKHMKSGKHPVKNRKQAIAIGLSKARKKGDKVPAA